MRLTTNSCFVAYLLVELSWLFILQNVRIMPKRPLEGRTFMTKNNKNVGFTPLLWVQKPIAFSIHYTSQWHTHFLSLSLSLSHTHAHTHIILSMWMSTSKVMVHLDNAEKLYRIIFICKTVFAHTPLSLRQCCCKFSFSWKLYDSKWLQQARWKLTPSWSKQNISYF